MEAIKLMLVPWLLVFGWATAHSTLAADFNVKATRQSVVFIKIVVDGECRSSGTGILMSDDGTIYTNRHVVEAASKTSGAIVAVGVPSPTDSDRLDYFPGTVRSTTADDQLDFAIVKIKAKPGYPPFKPLQLAAQKGDLGDDVAVIGYPMASEGEPAISLNKGSISSARVQLHGHNFYQTDATINPGNSGGPLLNTRGEVLGLVTLKRGDAQNMGYVLYADEIRKAVEAQRPTAPSPKEVAGPLPPDSFVKLHQVVSIDQFEMTIGHMHQKDGIYVLDGNGGEYTLRSKKPAPDNFRLRVEARIEFLQGTQAIYSSQGGVLRTMCIHFGGNLDKTILMSKEHAYLWRQSHAFTSLSKKDKPLGNAPVGNTREPFSLVLEKRDGQITVTYDDRKVIDVQDASFLVQKAPICVGGFLSRLHISKLTLADLGPLTKKPVVEMAPAPPAAPEKKANSTICQVEKEPSGYSAAESHEVRVNRAIDRGLAYLTTQVIDKQKAKEFNDPHLEGAISSLWLATTGNLGVTSLAVMAFLSQGHQPGEGKYGAVIEQGIDHIVMQQNQKGLLQAKSARGKNSTPMYDHCIAMLLLAEASHKVDKERKKTIDESLARALQLLIEAQNVRKPPQDTGGWRYQPESTESDLLVTAWALAALHACQRNGLHVPPKNIEQGLEYVLRCRKQDSGGFKYLSSGEPRSSAGEPNLARTAAAVYCLAVGGKRDHEAIEPGWAYILKNQSELSDKNSMSFYYGSYQGSRTALELGPAYWDKWAPRMYEDLLRAQQPDGSWPSPNSLGQCFATSLAILAMTPPQRHQLMHPQGKIQIPEK